MFLEGEALAFIEKCKEESKHSTPASLSEGRKRRNRWAYLALEICQKSNDKDAQSMVMDTLLSNPNLFSPESLFTILQSLQKGEDHSESGDMTIATLSKHLKKSLKEFVDKGPRKANDWSINENVPCSCEDCKQLKSFLRSNHSQIIRLPINKNRRQHLHHKIDCMRVPITHTTHRSGSPYTLVLEKLPSLFEKEKKIFQQRKNWLENIL